MGPTDPRWNRLAGSLTPQAVDELPAAAAAEVWVQRGEGERVPDAVGRQMRDRAWSRWIEDRGARLLELDEPVRAVDLVTSRTESTIGTPEPSWFAAACCDAARWADYWPTIRRWELAVQSTDDPSTGRYAMLNALFSPDPQDMIDFYGLLSNLLDGGGLDESPDVLDRFFLGALNIPREIGLRPIRQVTIGRSPGSRYPVDQLRHALAWITYGRSQEFVVPRLPDLFRPDPTWVRAFAQLVDGPEGRIDDFVARLDEVAQAAGTDRHEEKRSTAPLRTDELFGDWSSRFGRSWPSGATLTRPRLFRNPDLLWALRGDNPELRPVIRRALADAVDDAYDGLSHLGAIAYRLVPIPPADLHPKGMPELDSPKGRRTLVQLVEYVDRSGVMRTFLDEVRASRPNADLLGRVANALATWDDLNNQLLAMQTELLREASRVADGDTGAGGLKP